MGTLDLRSSAGLNIAGRKILLVGDYPPPHGGIAVHVQDLHRALQGAGACVRVLALAGHGRDRSAPHVTRVAGPVSLAAHILQRATTGYLTHAHISGHTPKSWLVALACALFRPPWSPAPLLTVHSGLTRSYLAVSRRRRALARSICRRFELVIAVSPQVAEALAEVGTRTNQLLVVPAFSPQGVAPGDLPPEAAGLRREFSPLLCAAVTDRAVYGARDLLEALPALVRDRPTAGAVVFGPNSQELAELARACRVAGRVRCVGELSRPQAQALIAVCDVFVRPTLADGDAVSVREALALGRPVAASAVGYRPAGVALFRAGDAEDLARAVKRALEGGPAPAPGTSTDGIARVLEVYAARARDAQG